MLGEVDFDGDVVEAGIGLVFQPRIARNTVGTRRTIGVPHFLILLEGADRRLTSALCAIRAYVFPTRAGLVAEDVPAGSGT